MDKTTLEKALELADAADLMGPARIDFIAEAYDALEFQMERGYREGHDDAEGTRVFDEELQRVVKDGLRNTATEIARIEATALRDGAEEAFEQSARPHAFSEGEVAQRWTGIEWEPVYSRRELAALYGPRETATDFYATFGGIMAAPDYEQRYLLAGVDQLDALGGQHPITPGQVDRT